MDQSSARPRSRTILFLLVPCLIAVTLIGHPLSSFRADAYFQEDRAMMYFRSPPNGQCNVYMDYTVRRVPHFSLQARDPGRLTEAERSFLSQFNDAFRRQVAPLVGDVCLAPTGSFLWSMERKQKALTRCVEVERRLGITQEGWARSRLPAPSNCIWPRLTKANALGPIADPLPRTPMTINQWMARARAGQ